MRVAHAGLLPEMVSGAFFCSASTITASFLLSCNLVQASSAPALLAPIPGYLGRSWHGGGWHQLPAFPGCAVFLSAVPALPAALSSQPIF